MGVDILPDSRLKSDKGSLMMDWPLGDGRLVRIEVVPTFCALCGKAGPHVPKENTVWVTYICTPCFEKDPAVFSNCVASDEEFRQAVSYEMRERFGRDLTDAELFHLSEQGKLGTALELLARESPYPEYRGN